MAEASSQAPVSADRAQAAWAKIAACLARQKQAIYDEIRHYPTPITACDQQFNYLLERQASLCGELARLQAAIDSGGQLAGFLESSAWLDDATKARLRSQVPGGE